MVSTVRSTINATPLEVEDPDELAKLPVDRVVTGEQLARRPGQSLAKKAIELGVTPQTLRLYHLEWRGSGYDPDYRIRRAVRSNWLRTNTKIAIGPRRYASGSRRGSIGMLGICCWNSA
jgi:hypothetical protein